MMGSSRRKRFLKKHHQIKKARTGLIYAIANGDDDKVEYYTRYKGDNYLENFKHKNHRRIVKILREVYDAL